MPEQPTPSESPVNGPKAGMPKAAALPDSTAASNGTPLERHEMLEVLDSIWAQAPKTIDESVTARLVDETNRTRTENLARKANRQRGVYFFAMLFVSFVGLRIALPSSFGGFWFLRIAVAAFLTALLEFLSIRHGQRTPWRQLQKITRASAGLCRQCGYQLGTQSLDDIRTRRCPECGTKWPLVVPFDENVEPMT